MNLRPASPILLVDDSPANLLALEAVLQSLGEPLVRAGSGQEALRRLRDADFAAVLLDVRMPGMDGYQVARELRGQPETRQAVLVALTGWGAQDDRARTRSAGFDHHLTKPAGLADVEGLMSGMNVRPPATAPAS